MCPARKVSAVTYHTCDCHSPRRVLHRDPFTTIYTLCPYQVVTQKFSNGWRHWRHWRRQRRHAVKGTHSVGGRATNCKFCHRHATVSCIYTPTVGLARTLCTNLIYYNDYTLVYIYVFFYGRFFCIFQPSY